ncbi:MAG: APC family permease [Candidatus Dormibacteraeota bacterium]|nr:APC family permease [Candidatus Dormibacteraeota bacterium]
MTMDEPVVLGQRVETPLRANTLNLFDTTVIATSSVAPAYTLAATLGLLIAAVGLASPAGILVGFFPVLFIAMAYYYLNKQDPNCGASYSWVSRTLNPYIGWMSGWIQLVANVFFCAAAPLLAGAYSMQLLNSFFPNQITSAVANNKWFIMAFAILWLALVTFMVARGIRVTANFQWLLVFIEVLIVVGYSIVALIKALSGTPANSFSISWFNVGNLGGLSGVVSGAVLAVFFFWGWDTAANVNEESKDADESPGQAGIISMFILLVIFLLAAVATQMFLSQQVISNSSSTILLALAQGISASVWIGAVMVLAVLSSTVATTQTTLLPSSRLTFSMARDGVFLPAFSRVHHSWRTPWVGTIVTAGLSLLVIVLTTGVDAANNLFGKLILDIGLLVALYYGITGIASAWAFRKTLLTSVSRFLFAGLFPLLGGIFLLFIAYALVVPTNLPLGQSPDWATSLPVLVMAGVGIPLVILTALLNRNGFFKRPTVSYVEIDGKVQAAPAGTAV